MHASKIIIKSVMTYLFYTFLWLNFLTISGYAGDPVTWAYFSYPPLFILEEDNTPTGFGFDIMNLAISAMPEYEHVVRRIPIKRFSEQMQTGKNCICSYGMIKTPDREKWAIFSYPCRLIMPRMIVIRKNDLEKFGGGSPVSLSALIKDEKLTLLLKKGTRYGERIDKILNQYSGTDNKTYLYSDELGRQALKMLMARRGDYFLSLSSTIYDIEKLGYADKIALIPIENETYLTGHIACSKTEKGREVIEKINRMLQREIESGKIYQILNRWTPDKMHQEFKMQYETLIAEPAKQ